MSRRAFQRREQRDEQGFFTIWILGLCAMVLGIGGLSFDLWSAFSDRREIASIVDAAAVAAASQIDLDVFKATSTVQLDPVAAEQAAAAYLANAEATRKIDIFDESITFQGGDVVITVSTITELTLTKLIVDDADFTVTVSGVANPRIAQ